MNIAALQNKKVCVIGFGKEGQAMCAYLEEHFVTTNITIADAYSVHTKYPSQIGVDMFKDLDAFDVLIVSPGVLPCSELDAYQGVITTMTEIFVASAMDAGATVIGVTGSKGKSTVTSLLYEYAKTLAIPVYIAGNIGVPMCAVLDQDYSQVVLELSSFQLDLCTQFAPDLAIWTNFYDNHLDRHKTLESYFRAKAKVFLQQSANQSDSIY